MAVEHQEIILKAGRGRIFYPALGDGSGELAIVGASYGARGRGAHIGYTLVDSPYGRMLVATTADGLCWLSLGESDAHMESELRGDYPEAHVERDDSDDAISRLVLDYLSGTTSAIELPLDIRATPFQAAVWRELCAIPRGMTRSYGEIARRLNRPDAPRAVGHAVGSNPISIFIPCHRAVGSNGSLTGYRWGLAIKRKLLNAEGASVTGLRNPHGQGSLKLNNRLS
ncbi:MAG: methylated-DNA--[protein]-cysteine S-methyltransferase [Candidatus Binataceae bacterium]